ncbi:unnamed protein product [Sphagnum jensenii]|uniref:Transcription regulator TrmB N-terminal domain-containing protein n=1 Tax=Sphagnum jensenii TaxID=128206 RepID=A0ABP0VFK1_9BRYO
MNKDIKELMRGLGLKDREGVIYLTCLQYKDGLFIHEITKLTSITRSTIDLTIHRLLRRGFINKIKVGRRFRYMADAPEAILFRQKRLVEDLEQVVPILAKLGNQKQNIEVIYFEGAEGYVRVHEDVLFELSVCRRHSTADSRNVPLWGNDANALRTVKYLPDNIKSFHADVQIYADNVMIYSPTPPVGGVIIRNAKVAESMRSLFNLVWNLLSES